MLVSKKEFSIAEEMFPGGAAVVASASESTSVPLPVPCLVQLLVATLLFGTAKVVIDGRTGIGAL